MVTDLNTCPMCGSPAKIDSTGAVECYGWAWQTISVECTDVMGKHCGMHFELQADHYYLDQSWQKAIDLWNSLEKQK